MINVLSFIIPIDQQATEIIPGWKLLDYILNYV
jgi:hypothetical protein